MGVWLHTPQASNSNTCHALAQAEPDVLSSTTAVLAQSEKGHASKNIDGSEYDDGFEIAQTDSLLQHVLFVM